MCLPLLFLDILVIGIPVGSNWLSLAVKNDTKNAQNCLWKELILKKKTVNRISTKIMKENYLNNHNFFLLV